MSNDGDQVCSGCLMGLLRVYWRWRWGVLPPWEAACREHDLAYAAGGTAGDRLRADAQLARCVATVGYPFLARLMFVGVGLGGHPLLPLPWRWGFRRPWPRGYDR